MQRVKAGECLDFNLVLDGFANMNRDTYKIFGMEGRYQVGSIEAPNPCY